MSAIAFAAKRHWQYPEEWIQLWSDDLTVTPAYVEANWVFFAAEAGRPIAWFALTEQENEYWLDYCWVSPEAIGRGVGRMLVHRALALAAEMQWPVLKVIADPNAEVFYRKLGFKRIGDHPSVPEGRLLPVLESNLPDRQHSVPATALP